MRNIIPVVLAGVLGIYGLIVAVIIQGSILTPDTSGATKYSSFTGRCSFHITFFLLRLMFVAILYVIYLRKGYAHLSAGLCCGLSGLAAGMAIGIVGDAGVRAVGQQEKLFVGMMLILIFAEALALYGTSDTHYVPTIMMTIVIISDLSFVCSQQE